MRIKKLFGGIIYLTKDPEPNTGTSIFESKTFSEFNVTHENHDVQKRFYTGEDVSDEEYEENFIPLQINGEKL